MKAVRLTWCLTDWGWVGIAFSERGLLGLTLPKPSKEEALDPLRKRWPNADETESAWEGLKEKLRRYFRGERVSFDEPLDLSEATPFQKRVWEAVRRIPWGETRTYGQIALEVGKPGAARAVGQAMARNPFPPVVPCHRVIGKGGALVGFGSGLEVKRRLLELESAVAWGPYADRD